MLNRNLQPDICEPEQIVVQQPEFCALPNGIPLYILDVCDCDVTRIDILMEGGRWHQKQPLQALFTNRMLREGTRRYTAAQIAEKLDYYGAWLDLASASEHTYVTLYSLNKYLPNTLDLLESIIKEPVFPVDELKVIINNNIQQFLVNSSKVEFLAHRGLVQAVYGSTHPVGYVVQENDYRKITSETLRQFYDNFYHSGGCSIYLSGRITSDCIRRVEYVFGTETFGSHWHKVEKIHYLPVPATERRVFIEFPDAFQSAVRIGGLSLDRRHPDYLKMRVVITLLGGYFGSRLMSNIREEKGYTYGISAMLIGMRDNSCITVSSQCATAYTEKVIEEIRNEMDKVRAEPIGAEELERVKSYMRGDLAKTTDTPFLLSDYYCAAITNSIPDDYFHNQSAAVDSITPEMLQKMAAKYLDSGRMLTVVAGSLK